MPVCLYSFHTTGWCKFAAPVKGLFYLCFHSYNLGCKVISILGVWAYCIESLTVDCNPFIEILSLWQHDSLSQVPAAQSCLGVFQQLILVGALWDVLFRLEGLR